MTPELDYLIDYYGSVGIETDGRTDILDGELYATELLRNAAENAITDIAVVSLGRGESCPSGYELVERTPGGHRADLNHGSMHRGVYLAIQRQYASKKDTYIADIQVVFKAQEKKLLEGRGWELVLKTVSGRTAKLNKGGEEAFLAVRREKFNLVNCPPAVCALCVVLPQKQESAPEGYRVIERDLNKGKFGDVVYLAYVVGGPFSLCRLPLMSSILDRYPAVESAAFPFPQDQLPMFVYPKGIYLEHRSKVDTPKPTFYSFVFTNVDGRRNFTSCLTFYEPVAPSAVRRMISRFGLTQVDPFCDKALTESEVGKIFRLVRAGLGEEAMSDRELDIKFDGQDCLFSPKTICVISRFPIYSVLRRLLRHLYAISLSQTEVPLERYITQFVNCIPMPAPGGRRFNVYLEPLEDDDPKRSRLKPLNLYMPAYPWLPLMDIDFSAPFRCLSVANVLALFSLMLQESKILFLSSRAELLTQVMEAMRSLLFPLEWQSVYIPRLPYSLSGCLECPGGFMIGMHFSAEELSEGTALLMKDLGLEGQANAVNLDTGAVLCCTGHMPDHPVEEQSRGNKLGHSLQRSASVLSISSNSSSKVMPFATGCSPFKREGEKAKPENSSTEANLQYDDWEEESPITNLPEAMKSDLTLRLNKELVEKVGIKAGRQRDLDQYESAFEFAPPPDTADISGKHANQWRMPFSSMRIKSKASSNALTLPDTTPPEEEGDDDPMSPDGRAEAADISISGDETSVNLVVRDIFLTAMAELLGGIGSFVRRSEIKRSRHNLRAKPLDELFSMADFLDGLDQQARPLVQRISSTQMFWVLVQQWLESCEKDEQLVFFEECVTCLKNRRADAVVPEGAANALHSSLGEGQILLVEEARLNRPDLYGQKNRARTESGTPLARRGGGGNSRPEKGISSGIMGLPCSPANFPTPTHLHEVDKKRVSLSFVTPDEQTSKEPLLHGGRRATEPLVFSFEQSDFKNLEHAKLETELNLLDSSEPALIIPGPSNNGLELPEGSGPQPAVYSYADGWPTPLDKSLLETGRSALPEQLLKLQKASKYCKSSHDEKQAGRGAPLGTNLMYGEFEPMIVLPYESFKAIGALARSDELDGIAVTYSSLKATRKDCFVVYISHRWLQPKSLVPHPDNKQGDKFTLICAGIEKLLQALPPTASVYIWFDYACIDQDDLKRRKRGIRSLPSYIERCDAMLTMYTATGPTTDTESQRLGRLGLGISGYSHTMTSLSSTEEGSTIEVDPTSRHLPSHHTLLSNVSGSTIGTVPPTAAGKGAYSNSKNPFATAWDNAWPEMYPSLAVYASRAWCRAELFMGTHIPLPPDGSYYFDQAGLVQRAGDRPLFVYGPEQLSHKTAPAVLPRLDKNWFKRCNPVEGFLTVESDRREIYALIERVQVSTPAPPKPGYKGQKRLWRKHGIGRKVFADGKIYEGKWKHGRMHGYGVMQYSRGSQYEGDWKYNKKWGKGSMTYPDGARYDGDWADGKRSGEGIYVYNSGAVYEGHWENGRSHLYGTYTSANGTSYSGAYKRGKRHGAGTMQFRDGRLYVGEWRNGQRHGMMTIFYPDGSRYIGPFHRDIKHGLGQFVKAGPEGGIFQQNWVEGKLESELLISVPEEGGGGEAEAEVEVGRRAPVMVVGS
ncbi:unnamed protein product [Chrysoparadoxa australica]